MSHLGATADLLKVARASLRESLMALLDAQGRYEAAMVANAMAIAVRELELGPTARAEERRLLGGFLDCPESTLPELRARLCRDLRAGAVDRERQSELRTLLQQLVHARLGISNPDYAASDARPVG